MSAPSSLYNAIVTLVLAPGIVSHEFAHVQACRLFGVRVTASRYLNPFAEDAYVDHERVDSFVADLGIAVAPLLVNTILGAAAFVAFGLLVGSSLAYLFGWLGAVFALTAVPSPSDTSSLFRTAGNLPRGAREVAYLVAAPVRALTAIPFASGIYGYVLAVALFSLAAGPV
ncbi:metalloprotease family protein [Haloarchaeobius amylolyticus]|uniref:metalloprotease family protein n=1 Tax=Haloarchaeobius amylolyticus TaxID=1198296 RepID=UPI00226D8E01